MTAEELLDQSRSTHLQELAGAAWSGSGRLGSNLVALAELLFHMEWHSTGELLAVAGTAYSARIHELRRAGWEIESEFVRRGQWRYRATRIGGIERTGPDPKAGPLGKKARESVVTVLLIVGEELGEANFERVADQLPRSWQEQIFPEG